MTTRAFQPLPIDAYLPQIVRTVRESRAAVVVAAPGAGKTTRVPPALASDGPVIVLQPRRVAARAIARRIADERGWSLGEDVGWHVRFERRFSTRTRVLLATEGILTARLLNDPLLGEFHTVILDEFHERSIHADFGLALARQAWLARDDLRLVVMSATIDAAPVAAYLDACPIVDVPGRRHPVEISYAPGQALPEAVRDVMGATRGDVLCFLAGAPEIRHAMEPVQAAVASVATVGGVEVLALHGSLDAAEQDRVMQPSHASVADSTRFSGSARAVDSTGTGDSAGAGGAAGAGDAAGAEDAAGTRAAAGPAGGAGRRRVILATNIAETSLTVPDVYAVVDAGLHKVARYDPARGIDSLDLERISADSADQRAGRAGRLGPGVARRLWDPRDRLRPHREPDIARIDLASPLLDLLAWGGDPETFEWFEAPPAASLEAAWRLLDRLGAVSTESVSPTGHVLTPLGRALQGLPLHPRLGRILLAARGAREAARACALLAERHFISPRHETTTCDLLVAIDAWSSMPGHVQRVARELEELAARTLGESSRTADDVTLRRAIFDGYADRVGRRRAPRSTRVLLASGHGAVLAAESGVREGEFLVAVDLHEHTPVHNTRALPTRMGTSSHTSSPREALIRIASLVDRDWLQPTRSTTPHWFDRDSGRVRAARREHYGELLLAEQPIEPDPDVAARTLAEAYLAQPLADADQQLLRRLSFAGHPMEAAALVARAAHTLATGARVPEHAPGRAAERGLERGPGRAWTIDAMNLAATLLPAERRDLERLAPERLTVPSGRSVPLNYHEDGTVRAAVKLQELFGLADTPRLGPTRQPVLLHLLAPNGRPVQMTRDLRSFWTRTYPEVRKELRGRYPKHPWPEDPWSAEPTARIVRRKPR
jgi:ATP-dependent helicase HrpB